MDIAQPTREALLHRHYKATHAKIGFRSGNGGSQP